MKVILIHAEEKASSNAGRYIDAILNVMGLKTKMEISVDNIAYGEEPSTDAVVITGFQPDTLKLEHIKKIVSDDYYPNKLLFLIVQERYNSLHFLFRFIGHISACDLATINIPYFVKYKELNQFLSERLEMDASLADLLQKFKFCLNVTNEDRLTITLENGKYGLNTVSLNIESEGDVVKDAEKEAMNYVMHCGMIDNGTYVFMEGYEPKVVRLERGIYESGSVCIIAKYAIGENANKFCSKITVWMDRGLLQPNEAYVNTNDLSLNRVIPLDEWLIKNELAKKTDKVFKSMTFEYPAMEFDLDKIPKSKSKIIMSRKWLNANALAVGILDMATGKISENVYSKRQYEELAKQLDYVD